MRLGTGEVKLKWGRSRLYQGEVAKQFEVEVGEVVLEQQVVVEVDAFFLDGAIEAFAVGVHLGGLGVGMPVGEQAVGEFGCEVALEFAAVVGEHGLDGEREDRLDEVQEVGGGEAGMAAGGPSPGEMGMQVDEGDEVAAVVLGPQFDGVSATQWPGC